MELPVIQPGALPRAAEPPIFQKIGIVGLGPDRRLDCARGAAALAVVARDRGRQQGRPRDGDAAARHRRRGRRSDRAGRGRPGDPGRAGPPEPRAARCRSTRTSGSRRSSPIPAARSGRSSTRRSACRPGSRSSAGIRSAGRRPAGLEHARPDLFKGRPWLFTPASDATGDALEKLTAFARALGALPRTVSVAGARSAAGLSQPSAAADRQRADAGRRRGGAARTAWRWPAAASSIRPGSRRARRRSGRTSPPPTPTRSAKRSTR